MSEGAAFCLVVNADDAGAHADVDAAILSAARDGTLLRSASVLAGGETAAAFVPAAVDAGLGLGLHVNLTEGRAVGGPYRTLTDRDGYFFRPKEDVWRRADAGAFDPHDVTREIRAQWDRVVQLGAAPDHIDGHNHIHLLPLVLAAVGEALHDRGPLWLRDPTANACPAASRPTLPAACFRTDSVRAAAERRGWRTADRFVGFRFTLDPGPEAIEGLSSRTAGVTEWMVHPGCRPGTCFTRDPRRAREAALLSDPTFGDRLLARGYRAMTFRGIA